MSSQDLVLSSTVCLKGLINSSSQSCFQLGALSGMVFLGGFGEDVLGGLGRISWNRISRSHLATLGYPGPSLRRYISPLPAAPRGLQQPRASRL